VRLFWSDETTVLSAGKIYQKLVTSEKPDLITFIEGTDTIARSYLDLLSHWILSELREPDTEVERDAFLKMSCWKMSSLAMFRSRRANTRSSTRPRAWLS